MIAVQMPIIALINIVGSSMTGTALVVALNAR